MEVTWWVINKNQDSLSGKLRMPMFKVRIRGMGGEGGARANANGRFCHGGPELPYLSLSVNRTNLRMETTETISFLFYCLHEINISIR